MTTALTLITDAAAKARIYSPGESMPAYKSAGMLRELNRMLGAWANDNLLIHAETEETLNLIAGKADYTIGAGASYDFNTVRPEEVLEGTFLRVSGGTIDYPLKVRTLQWYRDFQNKATQSIPFAVAYNPTYPSGTLYFIYCPGSAYELHLLSLKPLTSLAALTTPVSLPPGYEDAIVYNLACRIGPDYGKAIRPDVIAQAELSMRALKKRNVRRVPETKLEVAAFLSGRRGGTQIDFGPTS